MNTLRVGLIGAGGISRVHADGWRALGAAVSVYSHEGADALAEQYGFAVAPDLDALIAASDIVDIVTPTPSHGPLALAAIAAGRHVVCEKPLAGTAEEARAVVDAAREAGVRLFPAHVVRYFPEYAQVQRQVAAGRIGDPAVLRFVRGGEAPRAGWFHDEAAGGGIVRDQMIHDLDQALWLAGDVVRVYAVQSRRAADAAAPDAVTAHVVLTHASGALSHVQGSWGPRGMVFRTSADIAGAAGTLAIDSFDAPSRLDIPAAQDGEGYLPPPTHAESPYTAQLRDYVAAIAEGRDARVTAEDGIRAVAVAEAAMESLRTGAPVELDLAAAVLPAPVTAEAVGA
ncbi:Gfo/Idh/MocA family oxidoreductase [Leifsonia sp. NPDC080035]|uniref:Gfo/Idh/MocA family oxidoreductase n=1 Tax=Leifsonia sp. NPDC080035 TaxID=3143936 RepID=A0AAU7GBR4_9MICO